MSGGGRLALGIDLATAGVRARLLDVDDGAVVAEVRSALPAPREVEGMKVQPAVYAQVVASLLDELAALRRAPRAGAVVRALSVTGTSGTLVPVDAAGVAIADAVMYDDTSTAGAEVALRSVSRGRPIAMLPRAAAILGRVPGAAGVASPADVVVSSLLGHAVPMDTSHALKGGIDPAAAHWDLDLLAHAGIDPAMMPDLTRPGVVLGTARTGPFAGAEIVSGMTDGCTSQIATGAVTSGSSVGVLGTTLVLKAVASHEQLDPTTGIYSHLSPDGAWWPGGASNVGGGALQNLVPDFPGWNADTDSALRAAWHRPSLPPVYPVPGQGERFPLPQADLRFQAPPGWDRADAIQRAALVLEGIAMVERWGLDLLGADRTGHVLSGGGSRSAAGNRLRASMLGSLVAVAETRDSAHGAAVLAATALTHEPLAHAAQRLARRADDVEPDGTLVAMLDDRYAAFRASL